LQQVTGALKEFGATICAITPQPPEINRQSIERHKLGFDLLCDHRNEYAAALGLRFELPADLKQVYLSLGLDLAAQNAEDSWTLPMPGRFVIDRNGIVRAADVDPDYRYRPEPEKTVAEVKALK
jgi:peroxiredoxin